MTPHEIPNGKFRVPGWAKPIIFGALLTTAGWATLDYLATMRRLTVLETNYETILKALGRIDTKLDRLDPDYGPAVNPSGGGR